MEKRIFRALDKLGWSEFTINYDRRGKRFHFSTKGKKVKNASHFLIKHCGEHFNKVLQLIGVGKHEKVEFLRNRQLDVSVLICIHSTTLGMPAGGIRRHDPSEDELSVIRDTLNLARAMSFKDAAAGLPNGGSKLGVISEAPTKETPQDYYRFLAKCIDRSNSFTGPDMGFTLEDANRMRQFTKNIVGGTAKTGSYGATGKSAAFGVLLAMKEACQSRYGSRSLVGKKIVIQGLGQLGSNLAKFLIKEGAELTVSDISKKSINDFLAHAKKDNKTVEWASPPSIYATICDIFSPCAVGEIITRENMLKLHCDMIVGGANNQLKAVSQDEEIKLAKMLDYKEILFLPDWIVNAGGVIHGQEEHKYGKNFSIKRVNEKIRIACREGTRHILELANQRNITPLEAAYEKYEKVIYR